MGSGERSCEEIQLRLSFRQTDLLYFEHTSDCHRQSVVAQFGTDFISLGAQNEEAAEFVTGLPWSLCLTHVQSRNIWHDGFCCVHRFDRDRSDTPTMFTDMDYELEEDKLWVTIILSLFMICPIQLYVSVYLTVLYTQYSHHLIICQIKQIYALMLCFLKQIKTGSTECCDSQCNMFSPQQGDTNSTWYCVSEERC